MTVPVRVARRRSSCVGVAVERRCRRPESALPRRRGTDCLVESRVSTRTAAPCTSAAALFTPLAVFATDGSAMLRPSSSFVGGRSNGRNGTTPVDALCGLLQGRSVSTEVLLADDIQLDLDLVLWSRIQLEVVSVWCLDRRRVVDGSPDRVHLSVEIVQLGLCLLDLKETLKPSEGSRKVSSFQRKLL